MPSPQPRPRWRRLLRPRWLAWHAFAVCAAAGMLWLGDWQLRRAEAGNELSWAYTFEWPIFAVLGAVFWAKTIKEELRAPGSAGPDGDGDGAVTPDGAPARSPAASPAVSPAVVAADSADAAAYAAQLSAEIRRHGRWHGLR